ncbi:VCBS repeat-containing protein [Streptomyces canus]|uniref:FG-GAP repeat domain-containing protein n=1 Tax=Streptomyces canus TaxID=58343 RepID=UPI00324998D8
MGAWDLNGDGIGDLLAQDNSNNLYRYYGTGNGTFGARARVFSNWGGSYNLVVGVGDITGDRKADLVSRDSAGKRVAQHRGRKGILRDPYEDRERPAGLQGPLLGPKTGIDGAALRRVRVRCPLGDGLLPPGLDPRRAPA